MMLTYSPEGLPEGLGTSTLTLIVELAASATVEIKIILPFIVLLESGYFTSAVCLSASFLPSVSGTGTSIHNGFVLTTLTTLSRALTDSPTSNSTFSILPETGLLRLILSIRTFASSYFLLFFSCSNCAAFNDSSASSTPKKKGNMMRRRYVL